MPIFVIARKDAVLTKQSRSRQISWIASTSSGSRNDGIENLSGAKDPSFAEMMQDRKSSELHPLFKGMESKA
jgi:hypothetical protein